MEKLQQFGERLLIGIEEISQHVFSASLLFVARMFLYVLGQQVVCLLEKRKFTKKFVVSMME